MQNLETQADILKRDNITLDLEIKKLNDIIELLENEVIKGNNLINEITSFIDSSNLSQVSFFPENLKLQLEKKVFSIQEMIIVKKQSIMSLELIKRNNIELIDNIEKIQNVTLEAFNIACIVAKSLFKQNLILKKLQSIKNITKIKQNSILETKNSDIKTLQNTFSEVLDITNFVNIRSKELIPKNETVINEISKQS